MPNGQSHLYYKCFQDQLLLPLKNVMDSIMQGSAVPDAWKKTSDLFCSDVFTFQKPSIFKLG